jgi:hypothetical protein
MTGRVLGLPLDIPWKVIAVSPDMIDVLFCNKSSRRHGARQLQSRHMSHPTKICLTGCAAAGWPSSRSLARSRATSRPTKRSMPDMPSSAPRPPCTDEEECR